MGSLPTPPLEQLELFPLEQWKVVEQKLYFRLNIDVPGYWMVDEDSMGAMLMFKSRTNRKYVYKLDHIQE